MSALYQLSDGSEGTLSDGSGSHQKDAANSAWDAHHTGMQMMRSCARKIRFDKNVTGLGIIQTRCADPSPHFLLLASALGPTLQPHPQSSDELNLET